MELVALWGSLSMSPRWPQYTERELAWHVEPLHRSASECSIWWGMVWYRLHGAHSDAFFVRVPHGACAEPPLRVAPGFVMPLPQVESLYLVYQRAQSSQHFLLDITREDAFVACSRCSSSLASCRSQ